ncbi:hypothetical protein N9F36_06535 [Akkermansiaceae bacterium]|nr:hypothetical protein [Akkermansiaceae bacterium]
MDVTNESGVIATTEQMISLLKNTKEVPEWSDAEALESVIYETIGQMCGFADEDTFRPLIELNNKLIDWEENHAGEKELHEMDWGQFSVLEKALKESIVIDDSFDEKEITSSDELVEFWNNVLNVLRPEIPQLEDIRIFCKGGRLEGYDVPTGVVCFVFSSHECFEKKLTKTGEALKEAIGHCDESEWTTVSY